MCLIETADKDLLLSRFKCGEFLGGLVDFDAEITHNTNASQIIQRDYSTAHDVGESKDLSIINQTILIMRSRCEST